MGQIVSGAQGATLAIIVIALDRCMMREEALTSRIT